jgi:TatD DNase family protein
MACSLDLPVVIHSREAHEDVYNILKEHAPAKKGIIHCFTGDIEAAEKFMSLGFVLGIGGVVTFRNARELQAAVNKTPIKSIVLETDAPWLAPQSVRGKRNESANLKEIAGKIAELKSMDPEKVEEITAATAERVLNI